MSDRGRPAPDEIEPGIPATEELPKDVPPGWEAAEESAPLDVPQGVETWGTTVDEETGDEPLYQRVRREEPDRLASAAGPRDVALVDDQGLTDDEADLVGEAELDARPLAAEEAALRIEDEGDRRLGLNQDRDPGYVEER